jgi:uncharacterized membrane protein YbhN (UPF0104 family)
MWEKESLLLQERNPKTEAAHKKQLLWQVTMPLILGIIVILVLVVLAAIASRDTASVLGDIALIWLILPLFVILLVFMAIFGGLAYLVIRLNNALPRLALKAHHLIKGFQANLTKGADAAVKPIIQIGGWWATVRALFGKSP